MKREEMLSDEVRDLQLDTSTTITELVKQYGLMGGFTASNIHLGAVSMEKMLSDEKCTVFISFTANLVATGLRSVLAAMIARRYVDAVVTTGGSVDHDLARSYGGKYFQGRFEYDDILLKKMNIHRLGNVLVPRESYGPIIEKVAHKKLENLFAIKQRWTPSELLFEFGKDVVDEASILGRAAESRVPVFSPGLVDSAFGTALLTFVESRRLSGGGGEDFHLDLIGDMKKLSDIVYSSTRIGAFIIGGGVSKHHVIWWSQFRGGLDYAVYVTTAVEWDGSLSGAQTREAISWGKLKPKADHVTLYGDATAIVPLIYLHLLNNVPERARGEEP